MTETRVMLSVYHGNLWLGNFFDYDYALYAAEADCYWQYLCEPVWIMVSDYVMNGSVNGFDDFYLITITWY